jgi:1,4-alpha-glucan branching enzyme
VDHVKVIHNGTDAASERTASTQHERDYIFIASRLVEKKGVKVAVQALATLSRRGKRVQLVIAGDGPQRAQLEQEAHELGIASHITFLGSVPHETVRRLMRESRFVVVPSYWEAFGMVCVEAMAEARAVVATRTGGIPEIVLDGTTGILVEPDDAESLANGIARLFDDPAGADEMGRRGRARVLAHFTWDRMVDGYVRAYGQAMATAEERALSRGGVTS